MVGKGLDNLNSFMEEEPTLNNRNPKEIEPFVKILEMHIFPMMSKSDACPMNFN